VNIHERENCRLCQSPGLTNPRGGMMA
jgi:hypothetical protein